MILILVLASVMFLSCASVIFLPYACVDILNFILVIERPPFEKELLTTMTNCPLSIIFVAFYLCRFLPLHSNILCCQCLNGSFLLIGSLLLIGSFLLIVAFFYFNW